MANNSSDATFELPVVDFSSFRSVSKDATEEKKQVAAAVDDACRKHGFLCLRNTGISRQTLENAFQASKALFESDPEAKSKLKQLDPTSNIGYMGFAGEALNRQRGADLKETFNVRNPFMEDYPGFEGTSSEFQESAVKAWKEITTLSERFAECCAMALGLEHDYFSRTMKELDLCTLRLLHYPPCPDVEFEESDAGCAIRTGEHTDFGAFTFLFVKDFHDKASHGLQVKAVEGGDLGSGALSKHEDEMFTAGWKDVVFGEDFLAMTDQDESCSMLVNTGALMARWTNDVWRATAHRVIVTPESKDFHRYSIAAFFDPDRGTICSVHPKFVPEGKVAKYSPISSIDYLMMKLREVQGLGG